MIEVIEHAIPLLESSGDIPEPTRLRLAAYLRQLLEEGTTNVDKVAERNRVLYDLFSGYPPGWKGLLP